MFILRIHGRTSSLEKSTLTANTLLKFCGFFEKIVVEFNSERYPSIEWVKAHNKDSISNDAIEIERPLPSEPLSIIVKMFPETYPKEYKLSDKLSSLLLINQDTRARVINALWQYIKLNRLQDTDNWQIINCNEELKELFGEEFVEFSSLNKLLKPHLEDPDPFLLKHSITPKPCKNSFQ